MLKKTLFLFIMTLSINSLWGLTWTAEEVVVSDTNAQKGQVGVANNDDAVCTFQLQVDNDMTLQSKVRLSGTWQTAVIVDTFQSIVFVSNLEVADDLKAGIAVIGQKTGQSSKGLYYYAFDGSVWSLDTTVVETNETLQNPTIAMNQTGNVILSWIERINGELRVKAQVKDQGAWLTSSIVSPAGQFAFEPKSGIDNSGNGVVAWRTYDVMGNSGCYVIKASQYSGTWGSSITLSNHNGSSDIFDLAVSSNGKIAVSWAQFITTQSVVQTKVYEDSAWGQIQQIAPLGHQLKNVKVCINDAGNIACLWRRSNGAYFPLEANERIGGTWNIAKEISSLNNSVSNEFSLEIDSASTILALFIENGDLLNSTFSANTWSTSALIANNCLSSLSLGKSTNGKLITSWTNSSRTINASSSNF